MIDGRDFFNQIIKNCLRTYDNIQKLQQVKIMLTQLNDTIHISKNIIS